MDVKGNIGTLSQSIAVSEIAAHIKHLAEGLGKFVQPLVEEFSRTLPTPQKTVDLENSLFDQLREFGRKMLQWTIDQLEPEVQDLPGAVHYKRRSYRRLAQKTRRSDIVTRFGKVSIMRACYRLGRAGRTIFPLEVSLGIENGFTPAAASRIGKHFASCGSSQARTIEMIEDQMGTKIGPEKLRSLIGTLFVSMECYREESQVEKLITLIQKAQESGKTPVLSLSRDGVSLGIAPWGYFEMASVACISVLVDGDKQGTVYLGCVPETNQVTLTNQLTSLLQETIRRCGDNLPDVVYVSDAGKIETAYWVNTLRRFYVDGKRIKITRVVDYYHASLRLTTIADSLRLGANDPKRKEWLEHARWLLLQPGGHGRVLRSIAKMKEIYGFKRSCSEDAKTAERYLRRYRRFMDYAQLKSLGYSIGSGIVESACKQIVSERMKLSGMRWKKQGAQETISLRCILLSGVWDVVFSKWLNNKPAVKDQLPLATA